MQLTASTSSSATPRPSIPAIPRAGSTRTSTQLGRRRHPTLSLPRLAGEGHGGGSQGGGLRLTPLRRPDRSGFSDALSDGGGFFERSIDFPGSYWWRSHCDTFRMPTASGRSPSLSTSDHVIGMAIGAPPRARTA